jgi:hypothetical protein
MNENYIPNPKECISLEDLQIALDVCLRIRTDDEKYKADLQEMAYNIRKEIDKLTLNK